MKKFPTITSPLGMTIWTGRGRGGKVFSVSHSLIILILISHYFLIKFNRTKIENFYIENKFIIFIYFFIYLY